MKGSAVVSDNVSQKEEEEAGDFSTEELRASCSYVVRCEARSLRRSSHTMAEFNRKPPETQTHGGPVPDHAGGAQTKEGQSYSKLM